MFHKEIHDRFSPRLPALSMIHQQDLSLKSVEFIWIRQVGMRANAILSTHSRWRRVGPARTSILPTFKLLI